ncbi:hypothetical protein F5876DRAFT_83171 [Lentinula aff. lateritia]|uniref:Uncharacterized protein n=1 Tax=Lentinula aff. lateritia TaxID=2804960 RepID=A0ACC1TI51_9AGAR|nr:hypothetical protein F5876DRAFT_83171 [Lentinula aff. lateritia]
MESNEPAHHIQHVFLIVRDTLKTHLNPFCLFRLYKDRPSYDPDAFVSLDDLLKQTRTSIPLQPQPSSSGSKSNPVWPFNNMSTYRIMQWLNTGSSLKSEGEATRLVEEVLMAPDFNVEDLKGFKAHRENLRADKAKLPESSNYLAGFETASVDIRVPSVIREAFSGPLSDKIHFSPFKLFHQLPLSNEEIRVHGELYTSDSFIQAHDKIQRVPLPPEESDCKLERAVAVVMLWSDATHVANFGTAQMWPIYLMLGNISKYVRALPDSGTCHHLAYIPLCAIPAFEGLLPDEHNPRLMKLLYRLGEWHALAKLRMHTDLTLRDLSSCTAVVGTLMREFHDKTCSQFDVFELPSEQQARSRQQAQINAQRHSAASSQPSQCKDTSRKARTLNLFTYKFHAMADYAPAIRWFGTIDSYSTQLGELAHRLVKRLYGLTNKHQHKDQIACRYNRSKMLANARFAKKKADLKGKTRVIPSNVAYDMAHAHQVGFGEGTGSEDLDIPLDVHHFMSNRRDHPVHLTPFLLQQHSDPAKKNFVSKFEDHLLGHLKEIPFDGDYEFTADERQDVIIAEEKIYAAKTL